MAFDQTNLFERKIEKEHLLVVHITKSLCDGNQINVTSKEFKSQKKKKKMLKSVTEDRIQKVRKKNKLKKEM